MLGTAAHRGVYLLSGPSHSGHEGPHAEERFASGPDGGGWSYDALRVDPGSGRALGRVLLHLDATGAVRLHVEGGGWVLRGGTVGAEVLWRRGDDEREQAADGFTGTSPAYALATAQRAALEVGATRRLRLVEVTEPVLATRVVDTAWSRPSPDRWEVVDLATGERHAWHVEDGRVVAGPGLTLTRQ